jgi:4-hydroxy-tetrahydrodipicolinate synthase
LVFGAYAHRVRHAKEQKFFGSFFQKRTVFLFMGAAMPFQGLSAFPITPTHDDGEIDRASLRRLIRRLVDAGVDSIGLLGSTGSAPYLSRSARRAAVETAVAEAAGATPIIVGIGALATREVIDLARDAARAGAAGLLLAPISYTPLTDEEVYRHFATVAASVDLPLCVYNNPGTTHFTIAPALTARLSRVARIVAVKNPAPEADPAAEISALRRDAAAGFSVGVSVDWRATAGLLAGADAWYSVLAGTLPHVCTPIMQAIRDGDAVRAEALNRGLQPVWALFQRHSSLRVAYALANLLGLTDARPPRPILPLDEPAHAACASVLAGLGLHA